MGSFNVRGYLSKASIVYGDDIVVMIGVVKHDNKKKFYTLANVVPISLPIYGKYNDYGGIEDVEENETVKWLRKNIGEIDDIMSAVNEAEECNIDDCIKSTNQYHPETKCRYVYDNILKNVGYPVDCNSKLCLLFEHRDVYEKWSDIGFGKRNKFYNIKIAFRGIFGFSSYDLSHCFGDQSHGILAMHTSDEKFMKKSKKEIEKLQDHIWYMIENEKEMDTVLQFSQEDGYDADIEYHKKCIELLETLKNKHDYFDE